jgi:hypothetical protein
MAAAVTTLNDFAEIKCRITTARTLSGFTEYALDCTRYNKTGRNTILNYANYVNCSDFLRGRFIIFILRKVTKVMQGVKNLEKSELAELRQLKSTVSHRN